MLSVVTLGKGIRGGHWSNSWRQVKGGSLLVQRAVTWCLVGGYSRWAGWRQGIELLREW